MQQAADAIAAPARNSIPPALPARRRSRTVARLLLGIASLFSLTDRVGGHPPALAAAPAGVPGLIAAGPDGGVWFAERNRPRLGRIGSDGTVSEYVLPFTIGKGALTAAPDGALWAAVGNQVARITTDGATRMIHIPSPFETEGRKDQPKVAARIGEIAPGPYATIWYTIPSTDSFGYLRSGGNAATFYLGTQLRALGLTIAHYATWLGLSLASRSVPSGALVPGGIIRYTSAPDLATDQYDRFRDSIYTGHDRITSPGYMGLGPDGNAWFVQGPAPENLSGPARLSRILDDGQVTDYPLPPGEHPGRFVAGPDTAIWYTVQDAARIGKLSMGGKVRDYPLPAGSGPAAGIAAGTDGNLWLSLPVSRQVARLSPRGSVTLYHLPA